MDPDALQAVLTAEHREQGFRVAVDADFVYLYRHDKLVATFNEQRVAPEAIREAADRELKNS